jgi:hypothetical protein
MSEAKITGKVHLIEETKSYGAKGFRKRLVVLETTNGRFSNFVPLEFTREACDQVDEMKLGDTVEISYMLTGRKWQRDPQSEVKFFLTAEASSFKKVDAEKLHSESSVDSANEAFNESYDDGNIPF